VGVFSTFVTSVTPRQRTITEKIVGSNQVKSLIGFYIFI